MMTISCLTVLACMAAGWLWHLLDSLVADDLQRLAPLLFLDLLG